MNWYRNIKLAIKRFEPSKELFDKIKYMYELPPKGLGKSLRQISKEVGNSPQAIDALLKRHGIDVRNKYKKEIFNPDQETLNKIDYWYAWPPKGPGLSIAQIAKRLNITRTRLQKFFERTGREIKKIPYVNRKGNYRWNPGKEDTEKIINMYRIPPLGLGLPIKQIAKDYGVVPLTIKKFLIRKGEKIRSTGEQRITFYPDDETIKKIEDMYNLPPEGLGIDLRTTSRKLNISEDVLRMWMYRTNRKIRNPQEQAKTDFTRQQRKDQWKDRDFWTWLCSFPEDKRVSILMGMGNSKDFDKRDDMLAKLLAKSRRVCNDLQNPHLTPTVHSPYATGNEYENREQVEQTASSKMNWYKQAQLYSRKLEFCANCIRGWEGLVAEDATELAQIVENGQAISKEDLYRIAEVDQNTKEKIEIAPIDNYQFYYNYDKNIAWIYNDFEDVEYFYI